MIVGILMHAAPAATCEAIMVAQHSQKQCRPGINFGCSADGRSIWTRNCRGEFQCGADSPPFFCGHPPGAASYLCGCASSHRRSGRAGHPGDVCTTYGNAAETALRQSGGGSPLTYWRRAWAGPEGVVFDQSPRCSIHPELQTSDVWLPVTHTSDKWARTTTGVWMYYARGCSRLEWFSGKTLVAFNRLDAAVKLSLNGTCDLACAVRSVAALYQASERRGLEGVLAQGTRLCRPGQSEADREMFRFALGSAPLDPYLSERLVHLGFDSLQLIFQPDGGESSIGLHVQTELWDVRDGRQPTFKIEHDESSRFAKHLRCDGRRCALRYEGACLVCGDCVDHCAANVSSPSQSGPTREPTSNSSLRSACQPSRAGMRLRCQRDEARGYRRAMHQRRQAPHRSPGSEQCKLKTQDSVAPCKLGRSFGCDLALGTMWVTNCRGVFRCGNNSVPCGYPPGRAAYNCSCGRPRASGERDRSASCRSSDDVVAQVVSLSMARYADLVVRSLPLEAIDPHFASAPLQYGTNLSASAIVITGSGRGGSKGIGNHVHEFMNAAMLSLTLGLRLARGQQSAYTCGGLFESTGLFESLPRLAETRPLCPLTCRLSGPGYSRSCARPGAPHPFCSVERDLFYGNFSLFGRPGAEVYHLKQWDAAGKFQSQEAAMSRRADAASAALFARAGGPHALYGRIFSDFFRFREDRPPLASALAALEQRRAADAANGRGQAVTIAAQVRHRTSCLHGHEKVALFAKEILRIRRRDPERSCEVLLATDRRATFAALERALGNECALHGVERNKSASHPGLFAEHGVDARETAAADLGLLSHADHLVGSWGSTFTILIQSLIANRFLQRDAATRGEAPTVVYCELDGCLRPLPLIANWHISLQNYPQVDLWV